MCGGLRAKSYRLNLKPKASVVSLAPVVGVNVLINTHENMSIQIAGTVITLRLKTCKSEAEGAANNKKYKSEAFVL